MTDPDFREVFALQVAYSWANNAFSGEQGILDNLVRMTHLAAVIIHGGLDISEPLSTAWRLRQGWPGSQLVVVPERVLGRGHRQGCRRLGK